MQQVLLSFMGQARWCTSTRDVCSCLVLHGGGHALVCRRPMHLCPYDICSIVHCPAFSAAACWHKRQLQVGQCITRASVGSSGSTSAMCQTTHFCGTMRTALSWYNSTLVHSVLWCIEEAAGVDHAAACMPMVRVTWHACTRGGGADRGVASGDMHVHGVVHHACHEVFQQAAPQRHPE
jgi:hypothetical protein